MAKELISAGAERNPVASTRELLDRYVDAPPLKRLLLQIKDAQKASGFKFVTVLSMFPQEGKTFLVSVLALGYAKLLEKRVLIVDTVSPRDCDSFFYENVTAATPPANGHLRGIDLITPKSIGERHSENGNGHSENGNGAPQKRITLAADVNMREFLNSLPGQYDLVLLDTCAMSGLNQAAYDPVVLAHETEKALLVTSARSEDRAQLAHTRSDLADCGICLLGTIFNEGAKL